MTTQITIDKALEERLLRQQELTGAHATGIIRQALDAYLIQPGEDLAAWARRQQAHDAAAIRPGLRAALTRYERATGNSPDEAIRMALETFFASRGYMVIEPPERGRRPGRQLAL